MFVAKLASAVFIMLCMTVLASGQDIESEHSTVVSIKNPFYQMPEWKLWRLDESPVVIGSVKLTPPAASSRLYPIDIDAQHTKPGVLSFRRGDWPGRIYAGMWDDVYASFDNRHSYMPTTWRDESGNEISLLDQHMNLVYRFPRKPRLLRGLGLTFTSQSTTGMGHDLTDNFKEIDNTERNYCFANILRAGPAHDSYGDIFLDRSKDEYDAVMPCLFNSVGSSGSEVHALAKMLIVGAHLPKQTKLNLKRNGLYIPTLLYLWKAGLPYDVPYTNELRHRVAYASSGSFSDRRLPPRAPVNQTYHRYNETSHLYKMTNLAKGMTIAPPIALLSKLEIKGGVEKSINKTTIRVHQRFGKSVRMHISAADSFDIQDKDLTYKWTVLHKNTPVSINTTNGGREAHIKVPFDPKIPKGRTTILLTVNNGYYDSNPATINVYRPHGKDNLRPVLKGFSDKDVLSGESVQLNITSRDPEGLPVTLYRWSDEVGELTGNRFTWKTPDVSATSQESVHLIASDGTGGFNSAEAVLTVTPTLAVISADRLEGRAPFTVHFSAGQSRDKAGNQLAYAWNFDDGDTASGADIEHTFNAPGFYEVNLKVSGPFGDHAVTRVINVRHGWRRLLDSGWRRGKIDKSIWKQIGPDSVFSIQQKNNTRTLRISDKRKTANEQAGIESVMTFKAPLYLEATFVRVNSHKGAGFEVLGRLIGDTGDGMLSDTSIGYYKTDGEWVGRYIGPHLRADPIVTELQLYVGQDPKHPEKIRYTGFVKSKLGNHFIRLDNQVILDEHLRILSRPRGGLFEIQSVRVWAPN